MNDKKTNVMKTNCHHTGNLMMTGQQIEDVSDFRCLDSTLSTDGEVLKENNIRIGKIAPALEMSRKQEKYRTKRKQEYTKVM